MLGSKNRLYWSAATASSLNDRNFLAVLEAGSPRSRCSGIPCPGPKASLVLKLYFSMEIARTVNKHHAEDLIAHLRYRLFLMTVSRLAKLSHPFCNPMNRGQKVLVFSQQCLLRAYCVSGSRTHYEQKDQAPLSWNSRPSPGGR